MSREPFFSVVIPVRNERDDIEPTLENVLACARRTPGAEVEVVVVDDFSTDGTSDILERYAAASRIRLVRHDSCRGCSASRNTGITNARGDVVVFVDADNRLPPDFFERLGRHYEQGADFVSVESRVTNIERTIGRFQHVCHVVDYGGLRNVGFTQCFSCRRSAALAARFPEDLPHNGGDDVEFFSRLIKRGLRWSRDPLIVVEHWAPDSLRSFWRQRLPRGRAVPYIEYHLRGRSLAIVALRRSVATLKSLLLVSTLLPGTVEAARRARHSIRPWRDLPAFWVLWHADLLVRRLGEWRELLALCRVEERRR